MKKPIPFLHMLLALSAYPFTSIAMKPESKTDMYSDKSGPLYEQKLIPCTCKTNACKRRAEPDSELRSLLFTIRENLREGNRLLIICVYQNTGMGRQRETLTDTTRTLEKTIYQLDANFVSKQPEDYIHSSSFEQLMLHMDAHQLWITQKDNREKLAPFLNGPSNPVRQYVNTIAYLKNVLDNEKYE